MNGSRSLWSAVATDAAGKGELLEKALQAFLVLALLRIDFGIRAFKVDRSQHAGSSMARPSHEDDVQVMFADNPVQMRIYKGERRTGSPVPKHPILDVFRLERFTQERILLKINHSQRKVIAGPPESMRPASLFVVQGRALNRRARWSITAEIIDRRPTRNHKILP